MNESTVIALGFFDGVHIGHGELLKMAVRRAQERGCRSAAFTFDRSPREFVTGKPVPLLTTPSERANIIRTLRPRPVRVVKSRASSRMITIFDLALTQGAGEPLRPAHRVLERAPTSTRCADLGRALGCGGAWRRCAAQASNFHRRE